MDTLLEARNLLSLSLRHYRIEVRSRILRYKQLVALFALLLLPGLPAFRAVFVEPLTPLFRNDASAPTALVAGAGFTMITTVWARLQRDVLHPPDVHVYLASLPLSEAAMLLRDLVLLAFASAPLVLVLLLSLAVVPEAQRSAYAPATAISLFGSSLILQLGLARHYPVAILGGALCALVAVISRAPLLGLLFMLVVGFATLRGARCRQGRSSIEFRDARWLHASSSRVTRIGGIALRWRAIWFARVGTFRAAVGVSGLLGLTTMAMILAGSGSTARAAALLVACGCLSSLFLSLSFATLREQEERFGYFQRTLPVGRLRARSEAILAVQGICIAGVPIMCAIAAMRLGLDLRLFLAAPVTLALAALHEHTYRSLPRHAVTCAMLLTLAAMAGTIAII